MGWLQTKQTNSSIRFQTNSRAFGQTPLLLTPAAHWACSICSTPFQCLEKLRFPLNYQERGDFKPARLIWPCSFEWVFSNLQRLAIRVVNPLYDLLLPVLCSEAAELITGVNGWSAPAYQHRQPLMLSLFLLLRDKNTLLAKKKQKPRS